MMCSFDGCENRLIARGLCSAHYAQMRAGQELRPVRYVRRPVAERFWPKVKKGADDACWEWQGATDNHGYGQITVSYKRKKAHRVAYELLVGPIPAGLSLDHLCRNPSCVNPRHLEPVTHQVNVQRGRAAEVMRARGAAQTHCKNGHPFSEENTYRPKSGRRICRACQAQWQKDYQARKRAQ